MLWTVTTGYLLFLVSMDLYSTIFVTPATAQVLGQTSCVAIIYATTVKFGFPALESWRAHMRRLREEDRA